MGQVSGPRLAYHQGYSTEQYVLQTRLDECWGRTRECITKWMSTGPVNILLFAVPIGIIAGQASWDPVAVFVINFFAIIPLAAVLSFATEEISVKLGEALGGLLNATFGNAVELIVGFRPPTRDYVHESTFLD